MLRIASIDHLAQRANQVGERRLLSRAARVEHDVPLRSKPGAVETECLPKPALDAVSDDRSADRARNGKSQPGADIWSGVGTRSTKCGEQRAGDAKTLVIDEPELGGAENARSLRKRPRGRQSLRGRIS